MLSLMPLADAIERALEAYRALADLGETVAEEWQYVTDLVAVHSADLRALAGGGDGRILSEGASRAVDLAIEEAGLIEDPHRAIDWLSMFPQLIRLAVA
jgi:hypothetical protein